jgi:UDP-N-acetylmuramate dehydrogenase
MMFLQPNIPLAPLTTWGVGGPADRLFQPNNLEELQKFVKENPTLPKTFIGLGSNVLIRDGGLAGVVILLHPGLAACYPEGTHHVYVEAGTPSAKVAKVCAKAGLKGAAFLAGVPGTFGGALAMNAGAFGGETWPLVHTVTVLTESGDSKIYPASAFTATYRHIEGPPYLAFVSAILQSFPQGEENIGQLLLKRKQSQPIGTRNGGSVFKNPPGAYAAQLVEAAGLKGHTLGGAQISPKHANFILNTGEASAADIEQLIAQVQYQVQEKFGILLELEVKIMGRL